MAAASGQNGKAAGFTDTDHLLHPELLSPDFMQLILTERHISTRDCEGRDRLTEVYLRHVIPLPQRNLPDNRWGRRMEKTRRRQNPSGEKTEGSSNDQNRKRPLIVFDGKSSHSSMVKVKNSVGSKTSAGMGDRLKPPPAANLLNPVRKLSSNSTSSPSSTHSSIDKANLKREADTKAAEKSPQVKKKIQHVTWP